MVKFKMRVCPLLSYGCKKGECMWYLPTTGECVVTFIVKPQIVLKEVKNGKDKK